MNKKAEKKQKSDVVDEAAQAAANHINDSLQTGKRTPKQIASAMEILFGNSRLF